jgi:hypothetical protein
MKINQIFKKHQELAEKVEEVPWSVWTCFWDRKPSIDFAGHQASFGIGTDYKNKEEFRKALEWLVDQFGGTVKWDCKRKGK